MSSSAESPSDGRSRRHQTLLVVGLVAAGLGVLFALVNLDRVKVDWVVGSSHSPLVVVIAISFLLGAATGALTMRRRA